ncbi:MAG: ribonuclease HI [Mycobacteriaceae bacterium]|nr:ribonuclease HI [Mycobacteriaceae bacterium]
MIIVSTDGSCLRKPAAPRVDGAEEAAGGGHGPIGWAWVNHAGPSGSGGAASGTNQIAELRAVLAAVEAHPGEEPLLIESDSVYAIKCASEWVSTWRRNGWRTASGSAVRNAELIRSLDQLISARPGPVRFRWVRGHVGNYFNEKADALAGEAARASSTALDPDSGSGDRAVGAQAAAVIPAPPPPAQEALTLF